jgi:AcrR family transcriptional regulator
MLAQDGEEGLSLAEVVKRAGVNRSTAYQHFQTREKLIEATAAWVSERLCQAVFGDIIGSARKMDLPTEHVADQFARFAMENPELGGVWLLHLLGSQRPDHDRFFQLYLSHLEEFARSENAQPDIDVQVHSVLMLAATFFWPVWARARTTNKAERDQMAQRFAREMLRFGLRGIYRPSTDPAG